MTRQGPPQQRPPQFKPLDILRYRKWFGLATISLLFVSFAGTIFHSPMLTLLGVFTIVSVISRIFSCQSPFDLSTIGIFSILLALVANVWVGAVFALVLWIITMYWQPFFETSYHLPNAVAGFICVLLLPFFITWGGHNLVMVIFYYGVVRFVIEALVLTPIFRPGTIVTDFIFNISELPFNLFFTLLLIQFIGVPLLASVGITGWESGNLFVLVQQLV